MRNKKSTLSPLFKLFAQKVASYIGNPPVLTFFFKIMPHYNASNRREENSE
jgi:hypothetical protein